MRPHGRSSPTTDAGRRQPHCCSATTNRSGAGHDFAESANALLVTAFEATFVADRDDTQVTYGPVRRHDTGSPAVDVSCAIRTLTAPAVTLQHPVCGWVDQHTIGLIQGTTIVSGVEPTADGAESQTARLIAEMRADLPPLP